MTFAEAATLVAIPVLGAVGGAWRIAVELRVKRHVEVTRTFMDLMAVAHARGTREIGRSEQVAAVELVAAFAARDRLFRHAADRSLRSIEEWAPAGEVQEAAREARARLHRRRRWF